MSNIPATSEERFAALVSSIDVKYEGFHKDTYGLLKNEVMDRLKELWALEKFALGGAAAIAAWLLTHPLEIANTPQGWWLPALFLLLCAIRFITGMIHLSKRSATYLKAIEVALLHSETGGYEVWFEKLVVNETIAYLLIWTIAIFASCALAISRTWGV